MEEAQDRATQITRCTHWPKSRGQVAPRARQRRPDACSTMWWQVTASSLVTLVVLLGQTAFLARAELRIAASPQRATMACWLIQLTQPRKRGPLRPVTIWRPGWARSM